MDCNQRLVDQTASSADASSPAHEVASEVAQAYEKHAGALRGYAVLMARGRECAEDAVQEVFLRYFVTLSQGRGVLDAKVWLFRVMHNYLLDSLRSVWVKKVVPLTQARQTIDSRQNPEASYNNAELAELFLGLLTPRELECVRLRNEGFSYEEIADILSIHPGTVAALLSRGHKKIRKVQHQPASRVG